MQKGIDASSRRRLYSLLDTSFFCPSCTTWRIEKHVSPPRRHRPAKQQRHASTLSSSTAVNATKAIPARYRDLYDSLNNVKKQAAAQVNLSRLQLALQSLESESPTTRVAVLGLNVQTTARRLVRLLLADALGAEEKWEKELVRDEEQYSQGLLIRYGQPQNASLPPPRSVVPVLRIPSSILQRNKIEILISAVSGPSETAWSNNGVSTTSDAFLTPMVNSPADANGRTISLSQPVHSSLLAAQGLDELVTLAELLASTKFTASDRKLVDLVLNLGGAAPDSMAGVLVVDATKAEQGLSVIRSSMTQATVYERDWLESGMPSLSKWLTLASAAKSSSSLPSPVKALIASLLASADSKLKLQNVQAEQSAMARSMSTATRASLEDAVTVFSREAHQELQSGLASAWKSRNWRKLAWYKLFWRVDDVGLIITDLVSNAWLPETERAVYELSGRLIQCGISPVAADLQGVAKVTDSAVVVDTEKSPPLTALQPQLATATPPTDEAVLVNTNGTVTVEIIPPRRPVPIAATISSVRQSYMVGAITDLTTTAQQLVFRTLSITGLTAGLSGLAYFSVAAGSIYEAGTIVALGTAYALRTMQTDWRKSCKTLEGGLMDTGREVIGRVEERMRSLVQTGGRVDESEVEVQSRTTAADAIASAHQALKKVS